MKNTTRSTLWLVLATLTACHSQAPGDTPGHIQPQTGSAVATSTGKAPTSHRQEGAPGEPAIYSQNTWDEIDAWSVVEDFGFRGSGLTVALTETAWVSEDHPELDVTRGNNPVDLTPGNVTHANRVAAIMAADGNTFPETQGFLPDADVIAYKATSALTAKKTHYKFAKWAWEDGAVLMNSSFGVPPNCNKLGEYSKHSKWRDKAIHEMGILVVVAAGNTKDSDGNVDPCLQIPFGNIKHDTAKNDLVVGNWNQVASAIDPFSMVGPTEDGRLKPDIVAPGESVATVDFDEDTGLLFESPISGTSAAAPVVSGIAGWVYEELGASAGAHIVKSILLHTARDVGLAGPDFTHGYGLVQAAPALELARNWSSYGWEGTVPLAGTDQQHQFDVGPNTYSYKVTLVWSDVEGSPGDALALVNNLDLTVVSPDGSETYYPWELSSPGVPAAPGTGADQINNVEQIVLQNADGSPLDEGQWTVVVGSAAALQEAQDFAVALDMPCPRTITSDTVLRADLDCGSQTSARAVVEVVADGVRLDCDHFAIRAGGAAVGISVQADDVEIMNCDVLGANLGIELAEGTSGASLRGNSVVANSTGIALNGSDHQAYANFFEATNPGGTGAAIDGSNITLGGIQALPNSFGTSSAVDGAAVDILPGSQYVDVSYNDFFGDWAIGVYSEHRADDPTTLDLDILENDFEGIFQPVVILGGVERARVTDNTMAFFDSSGPAVLVEQADGEPINPQIIGNEIYGGQSGAQTGITLKAAKDAVVRGNIIEDVGTGISDTEGDNSMIETNQIYAATPPFRVLVGVVSSHFAKSASGHIQGNTVTRALTGISLEGGGLGSVSSNTLNVQSVGIEASQLNPGASITGNNVSVNVGVGISVQSCEDLLVGGNTVNQTGGLSTGIAVSTCPGSTLSNNDVFVTGVGIVAEGDSLEIRGNTLGDALNRVGAGVRTFGDYLEEEDNEVYATQVALHHAEGNDAEIRANTLDVPATGIRLGQEQPGSCTGAINVDSPLVETNTITGAITPYDVLCDVDGETITP